MSSIHRSVVSRQFNRYLTKHRSLQQLYKLFMMLAFAVAFLTSGQVMAVTRYSVAAGGVWSTAATWDASACGIAAAGAGVVPSAGEDVNICAGTVTGGTGTVKSLTLNNPASALTLSGSLTVSGTIAIDVGGAVLTGTGQTITLGGNLGTDTAGNIAGSPNLTLTGDANHTFNLGGNLTVGALTLMTPTATRTISVTAFTIIASSLTGFATCSSAASPVVAAGALASPIASTSGGSGYSCAVPVVNNVSAPIFSTKEKAAVFSEEVK